MVKWRPWPPILSKKYQVNLIVHSWEGLHLTHQAAGEENGADQQQPAGRIEHDQHASSKNGDAHPGPCNSSKNGELGRVMIKVKWKGSKGGLRLQFRNNLKRTRTTEKVLEDGCIINWDEQFEHVCVLSMTKDCIFLPWDIHLMVIQVCSKSKVSVIGTANVNLGEYASATQGDVEHTTKVHILGSGELGMEASALIVTVKLRELVGHEGLGFERCVPPSLHCLSGPLLCDQQIREEMKVRSMRRSLTIAARKTSGELVICNGKLSPKSEESSGDTVDSSDTDSIGNSEGDIMASEDDYYLRSYGPLARVNRVLEGALLDYQKNNHADEPAPSRIEAYPKATEDTSTSDSDQSVTSQQTMRSLLSWKRRKTSRTRGEPLLNKAYGEDGGDDIDRDRRLSGYPIEPLLAQCPKDVLSPNLSDCLSFGEEHFSVGSWVKKDLVSRDGHMKLTTQVFFASIDQRHEKAAGESACTALVAVMAHWLHQNPDRMPIEAEFDTLIREGSAEWRKLCDVEMYRNRFPDRHFDLDTILEARIRPLMALQAKSFVGFFKPEGVGNTCDFLHDAMTFDDIWEAIEKAASIEPAVYIASWNDHFFVLKVDREAYYIIDTLGERLYEGCKQAYILRFDVDTSLCHVPITEKLGEKQIDNKPLATRSHETKESPGSSSKDEKQDAPGSLPATSSLKSSSLLSSSSSSSSSPSSSPPPLSSSSSSCSSSSSSSLPLETKASIIPSSKCNQTDQGVDSTKTDPSKSANLQTTYKAKEACKEFFKGFFAALPLRELQTDIQKGLMGSTLPHKRLQIEFHYTSLGPMPSASH